MERLVTHRTGVNPVDIYVCILCDGHNRKVSLFAKMPACLQCASMHTFTGMDKTSCGHQLWEFICESLCPRHVGRNYVPLFGVQTAWHNRTSTYVIT